MAQIQCGECGELSEATKAFCAGCGNPLIEEEGREASRFEKMDNTVQLGQTMYNQMLSDMGLSVEKGPPPPEKRVEIIAPAAPAATTTETSTESTPSVATGSNKAKWIILAALIVAGLLFVGLLVAAVMIYTFWSRNS